MGASSPPGKREVSVASSGFSPLDPRTFHFLWKSYTSKTPSTRASATRITFH